MTLNNSFKQNDTSRIKLPVITVADIELLSKLITCNSPEYAVDVKEDDFDHSCP